MPTRAPVMDGFIPSTGMSPMTLERQFRVLGAEGRIPRGGPGRRTAEFDDSDLANVVLSLGATQPSEAGRAVRVLSGLYSSTNALVRADDDGIPLNRWVRTLINRLADPDAEADFIAKCSGPEWDHTLSLTVNLDEPAAVVRMPRAVSKAAHKNVGYINFHPPGWPFPPERSKCHRRIEVSIDFPVFLAAGRLLAGTIARRPKSIPNPAPGRAGEGDTNPETSEAAGSGNHSGLTVERSTQSARTEPLNKVQSTASTGSKQLPHVSACSVVRDRAPFSRTRTDHHGAYQTDTATP